MNKNLKPGVFLDNNVLISGLYSDKSSPGVIIDYFVLGKISVIISQKVLNEAITVIKIKFPLILSKVMLFLINYPPVIIKDPEANSTNRWAGLLNKDDAIILEAAISCQAQYFITGDMHFFNSPQIQNTACLKIMRPNDFVRIKLKFFSI